MPLQVPSWCTGRLVKNSSGLGERTAAASSIHVAKHCHGSSAFSHQRLPCMVEARGVSSEEMTYPETSGRKTYLQRLVSTIQHILHVLLCEFLALLEACLVVPGH